MLLFALLLLVLVDAVDVVVVVLNVSEDTNGVSRIGVSRIARKKSRF